MPVPTKHWMKTSPDTESLTSGTWEIVFSYSKSRLPKDENVGNFFGDAFSKNGSPLSFRAFTKTPGGRFKMEMFQGKKGGTTAKASSRRGGGGVLASATAHVRLPALPLITKRT